MTTHAAFPTPPPSAGDWLVYARSLMLSRGDRMQAILEAEKGRSQRAAAILRSAVVSGTTTDSDWAAALVDHRIAEQGFIESIRSASAFDAMLPSMRRVPLETNRIVVATTVIIGSEVEEGAPKPITMMSFAPGDLPRHKASTIVVLSADVMRLGGAAADSLLAKELRGGTIAASDEVFIGGLAAVATPVPGTGDLGADLAAALAALSIGAGARIFIVMSGVLAAALSVQTGASGFLYPGLSPSGGQLANMPVLISGALADDAVLVVDASRIIAAADPLVMDSAQHASVVLDDAPTPAMAAVVNLWQLNLVGLRCERWLRFAGAEDSFAALISPVTWGSP